MVSRVHSPEEMKGAREPIYLKNYKVKCLQEPEVIQVSENRTIGTGGDCGEWRTHVLCMAATLLTFPRLLP